MSAIDSDIDDNGVVQYFLFGVGSNHFTINQTTGEIRVAASGVDFELVNVIGNPLILTLIVQDNGKLHTPPSFSSDAFPAGTPLMASASTINITVLDSNDNMPVFTNSSYSVVLQEGPVEVLLQVLVVNASDADSGRNGEIMYSIAGGDSADFQIHPITVSM